ncbi:MAG: hypothetical protein V4737_08630 [Curtobacterium sp.]
MSMWNEQQHARDSAGKFTDMAGSAPEGSLATQAEPTWAGQPSPTSLAVREARYEAALRAYWDAGDAISVLSAQNVAARVRQCYPAAVGVQLTESDQSLETSYDLDSIVLADGSRVDSDDDTYDELFTCASDVRPRDCTTWLARDGRTASFSIDEVLALDAPRVGRFVVNDEETLDVTGAERAEHVMRSGWVDLPENPAANQEDTETALRDAMADLVHFTERYGFDAEAILSEARDVARTEHIDQH